jgi:hypothetical protein
MKTLEKIETLTCAEHVNLLFATRAQLAEALEEIKKLKAELARVKKARLIQK